MIRRGPWARARSLTELGDLTAQWLEGRINEQPGYYGSVDVDESEAPGLTAALIIANRSGYLTHSSQAGFDGSGIDGAHWRQLAWVTGFAVRQLAEHLKQAADGAGYRAILWRPHAASLDVTWREGRPMTSDRWMTRRVIRRQVFPGIPRNTRWQLYAATQVAIVDPIPGRNTLWSWLASYCEPTPTRGMSEPTRGMSDRELSWLDVYSELGRVVAVSVPGIPSGTEGIVTCKVGRAMTVQWPDCETLCGRDQVREL